MLVVLLWCFVEFIPWCFVILVSILVVVDIRCGVSLGGCVLECCVAVFRFACWV